MSVTKSKIVSQIQTQQLITYTLSHTHIQKNFGLIVEALSLNEDQINGIKLSHQKTNNRIGEIEKILQVNKEKQKNIQSNNDMMTEKINHLNEKVNQIQKKLSMIQSDFIRQKESTKVKFQRIILNPQNTNPKNDQNSKKNQDLMRIVGIHEQTLKKINQKLIHNQTIEIKNKQTITKDIDQLRKQINKISQQTNLTQIKKQIQQLKHKIGDINIKQQIQIIKKTANQDRLINSQQFTKLQQQLDELKKISEEEKRIRVKNTQQLWKLNEQLHKIQSERLQREMSSKSIIDLQKEINDLKIKLSILLREAGTGARVNKSAQFQLTTKINQTQQLSPNKNTMITADSDIRGQMLDKMKQTKSQILKAIRKADLYAHNNEFDPNKVTELQDLIKKIEHVLQSKSDNQSMKKMFAYIENKINYVFNIVTSGSKQQDALAAKRQWLCLSCDKRLDSYKGKVGNFLPSQQSKGKTPQSQIIGGGMNMRSRSKVDLPNVLKIKK